MHWTFGTWFPQADRFGLARSRLIYLLYRFLFLKNVLHIVKLINSLNTISATFGLSTASLTLYILPCAPLVNHPTLCTFCTVSMCLRVVMLAGLSFLHLLLSCENNRCSLVYNCTFTSDELAVSVSGLRWNRIDVVLFKVGIFELVFVYIRYFIMNVVKWEQK